MGSSAPSYREPNRLQFRALSALYATAGCVVCLNLAIPGSPTRAHAVVFGAFAAATLLIAGLLGAWGAAVPERAQSALLIFGVLLVTAMVIVSHRGIGGYVFFYVWAASQAGLFLRPRTALWHAAIYSGLYAVALARLHTHDPAVNWLMASATMIVIAVLILSVRERTDRLMELLSETARTDHLTGLLNRRGFEAAIAGELARANRFGAPLALIIGDLDHFKTVNDTFGHQMGDQVLREFAASLGGHIRPGDQTGRLGGEEFGILLPGADGSQAAEVAQRVRAAMSTTATTVPQTITATFGIAVAQRGMSAGELMRAADRALYGGKNTGRDRIVVSPAPRSAGSPALH